MTTRRSIALILSPVGLLLISAARLIIVANFNTTTAVTIASSSGFVNTLLGTVIPLIPVFMPYVALLLLLTRHFLLSIMTFIFAAFISPTSITAAEGLGVVEAYWNRTAAVFHNYRTILLIILIIIFIAVWSYTRSFVEGLSIIVVMVAAFTLVIAIPNPYFPLPVRLANNNEHHLVARASSGASGAFGYLGSHILVALGILAIVFIVYTAASSAEVGLRDRFYWLLTSVVALIAAIAFFPYLRFIYPVPQNRGYYAEAAHSMWSNAVRIELDTHLVYYGYVLTSDAHWFTVLLVNSRLIAYLPTAEVVGRSVCQPGMQAQPNQSPPLIPWLYHRPRSLRSCASEDEIALITSFLSSGQSLREISSITNTEPERIIFLTNRHLHEKLSAALRTYECRHDWNAPTPVGQRFYYYPRLAPY
jgi:hypothetical protein